MFVDREEELKALERAYQSKRSELFIILGRRRIGKTELIKHFSKNKKHVYFLAKKQNMELETERFSERVSEQLGLLIKNKQSFESVFKELIRKNNGERIVIVIDEFTYWVEKEKSIISNFQYIWDEILKDENVFLIISGSMVSLMETEVLGIKSPLYGRRTGQIALGQLPIGTLKSFLPSYPFQDIINVFGVTGGVPYYIMEFDSNKSFRDNLIDTVFNKSNILSMEAEILLREELREVNVYFAILRSILEGATKTGEIAAKSRVDITNINKYLRTLIQLRIIKEIQPVTEPPKSKNSIYKIRDNYMRFWLSYYYYNEGAIEEDAESVVDDLLLEYDDYIGRHIFEDICRMALPKLSRRNYSRSGSWWHGDEEIDIVAINGKDNSITFGECKWRRKKANPLELKNLLNKAKKVTWKNEKRQENFVFFSKSGFDKDAINYAKKENIMLFDLSDIERVLLS
jgi:hypothetical protein